MEMAVAPFVTVHPKKKIRMPGQSVTFCCEGEGNPPPEIEWFKENNVIDKSFYNNNNNTLEINDVQGLNGSYRCRAINQFGSEFSNEADLMVLENSEDSCSSIPLSSNVSLPPGCLVNGTNSTTVDVGECEPITCVKRGVNFTSSCSDPPLCCSPLLFESVAIKCGVTISFEMSVVKRCGCGKCKEKQTIISGVAIGQDGNPATSVDLVFGGKSVGSTDAKGKFSFPVPKTTKRAIVTFKDLIHKKFVEEEKIFVVEEGQTAIYTVKLREKPAPVIFNASEPLDVPLGSDSSDGFADLELPENALLNEDGSVFEGIAKATVSVTDPRNQSDIESAPGDFSAMSEDGEEELLQTFGMIKVNLEDDNGKPLTMSKPMKVYLDPEKLNLTGSDGNVSVKLYWLDKKTGRWREAGEFKPEDGKHQRRRRSKRMFLAGTVTPYLGKRNLNFDTPNEQVALRVTVPDSKNDKDGAVLVRVGCFKPPKGYIEKITTYGVACIPIWRDAKCFVHASRGNNYYITDIDDTSAQKIFDHVKGSVKSITGRGNTITYYSFVSSLQDDTSIDGPTYSVNPPGKNKCEDSLNSSPPSNLKKSRQFVFKKPADDDTKPLQLLHKTQALNWATEVDEKCFIKINYTGKEEVVFMATSYGNKNFEINSTYGYNINTTQFISGKNVVCLQFKCPNADEKGVFLILTPINSKISGKFHIDDNLQQIMSCDKDVPVGKGQEMRLCITSKLIRLFKHGSYSICLNDQEDPQVTFRKE
ncbi:cartilage intermediate layer protein 1-like [Stylophora pistillata]|uniref:cartilage intermediate layer protein 1-like n=1 Tax=Stylophora pistillata TaxID=50429 RepID=UPI000C0549D1|nr:cartilage intermediate layer protein 1-like [Stylophora pistillata]XP_022798223.1 cartilage intermediate layer protein 1-like [Stylophora pistillata]